MKNKKEIRTQADARNETGGIPLMMNVKFIGVIEEFKGDFSIKLL
jgi:hypothetical protein